MEAASAIIILFYCFWYSSQEKLEDVSTIILLFSNNLGIQVKRTWRTSQLLSYFFSCFGCSRQEKVEDVWALIILVLMPWVLKSRESEGRLNYCHTFSIALGTHVKRKWVTSQLLSYSFYCLVYLSHEKVEDVSSIIILFLVLWVLKSRESGGRLNHYHTFRLLWVLKSRESPGRLSYYNIDL